MSKTITIKVELLDGILSEHIERAFRCGEIGGHPDRINDFHRRCKRKIIEASAAAAKAAEEE